MEQYFIYFNGLTKLQKLRDPKSESNNLVKNTKDYSLKQPPPNPLILQAAYRKSTFMITIKST